MATAPSARDFVPDTLAGRILVIATQPRPDFSAVKPAEPGSPAALWGSGGAMARAGNDIVEKHRLDDPAAPIAERLAGMLQKQYRVRVARDRASVSSEAPADVAREHPDAELMLEARTLSWSMAYFASGSGRYRVLYAGRLRLLDLTRATVLAQSVCEYLPDETAESAFYDELLANDAERLKNELAAAVVSCVRHLGGGMLALDVDAEQSASAVTPHHGRVRLEDLNDLLPRK